MSRGRCATRSPVSWSAPASRPTAPQRLRVSCPSAAPTAPPSMASRCLQAWCSAPARIESHHREQTSAILKTRSRCRRMTGVVQDFGRRHHERRLLLRRPASKKRQGTKSREGWAPCGRPALRDLIVAPVMMVGAKLARGDLDSVGSGAWKRAMRISVVAWSISTGDRFVDWRGWAERDRRQRGASATEREMGFAAFDRRGQPSSAGELIPEFSHGAHPNSPPRSFRSAVQEILD